MVEDPEPARNISGGRRGGGTPTAYDAEGPETVAQAVVERLGELYWEKSYGGRPAFECLVRTILSQNTSDAASQPAFDALIDRYGGQGDLADTLAEVAHGELAETISGAGLYNQKASHIRGAAEAVLETYGSAEAFDTFVRDASAEEVRRRLLTITGVGPKTADCVLLFAGGREGVFPVDTHVHRLYRRLGVAPPAADHETVREVLERDVAPAACGFGHTASIQFGREYCTATNPVCLDDESACPLNESCAQVGIDREEGTAVDPEKTL
jgi:endonuclease-3